MGAIGGVILGACRTMLGNTVGYAHFAALGMQLLVAAGTVKACQKPAGELTEHGDGEWAVFFGFGTTLPCKL